MCTRTCPAPDSAGAYIGFAVAMFIWGYAAYRILHYAFPSSI